MPCQQHGIENAWLVETMKEGLMVVDDKALQRTAPQAGCKVAAGVAHEINSPINDNQLCLDST
jgi:hypothetical protein